MGVDDDPQPSRQPTRSSPPRRLLRRSLAASVLLGVVAMLFPGVAAAQEDDERPPDDPETEDPTEAPDPEEDDEAAAEVWGTMRYRDADREWVPVQGVVITVAAVDGEFEEIIESDEEGGWEQDLPEAGDYRITVDPDTIPEEVFLQFEEDKAELTLTFNDGQRRPVLFSLTTGDDLVGGTTFDRFLRLSVEGIRFGLIIAMAAVGLSLIFGTTGLVNFAHAEMVTFGALVAFFFNQTLGWHMVPSALVAIAIGGLFGLGIDRTVWHPLRNRGVGLMSMLVISIGMGLLLRYIFLYQFGDATRTYAAYRVQDRISLGPVDIAPRDLWIIVISILLLVGVAMMLEKTRAGTAIRAVADNRELAESSGVNVERVIGLVWLTGGALAAVGGIFQGLSHQVGWQLGFQMLLLMFAAVILGGLGTAYGAFAGGILIGLIINLSTMVIDAEFKTAAALFVMILVLLVRPQGIFGRAERVG